MTARPTGAHPDLLDVRDRLARIVAGEAVEALADLAAAREAARVSEANGGGTRAERAQRLRDASERRTNAGVWLVTACLYLPRTTDREAVTGPAEYDMQTGTWSPLRFNGPSGG